MEADDVNKINNNFKLAQDSSELFDIYPPPPDKSYFNSIIESSWGDTYFPSPKSTGQVKERSRVHSDGDWHRSVQIWVVQRIDSNQDSDKGSSVRVLLQRRSAYKDTHPNLLDVSCAGHVNAGDDVPQTAMRELEEELGGRGAIRGKYSTEDIEQSKAFVVTSSIEGETERFGKFVCREYQDVFILWWDACDGLLETSLFAPVVQEEVSGFEVMDGEELIQKMLEQNGGFVPRSIEYVNALAKVMIL